MSVHLFFPKKLTTDEYAFPIKLAFSFKFACASYVSGYELLGRCEFLEFILS